MTLKASSIGAISYQWLKDGVVINGETGFAYIASVTGLYTVMSYNAAGCVSAISEPTNLIFGTSADLMIAKTSESRPIAIKEEFEYLLKVTNNGPDPATIIKVSDILPKELSVSQLQNPSMGTTKYLESTHTIMWEIPKMDKGETAELRIKAMTNTSGPVSNMASAYAIEADLKMTNNIAVDVKQIIGLSIPNVFTPNNDGKNDHFVIKGLSNYELNELSIINRWGSSVYEKKGYANDWNGSSLSDGTYFYLLRVKASATSKWEEFKGYLTLIH